MIVRICLVLSLLALPVASAGISEHVDVLPDAEQECDGGSWSASNTTVWHTPWGQHREGTYYSLSEGECRSASDVLRGNVTARGHEVASVRVGESANGTERHEAWYSYTRDVYGEPNETPYATAGESYGAYARSRSAWEGREAIVGTELATLRVVDGCGSESSAWNTTSTQGYTSWQDGNVSYASGSYSHSGSYTGTESCEQTANVESGITNVRAGHDEGCARESSSYSYEHGSYGQNWSESHAWWQDSAQESCTDTLFASAGSERVDVGERSTCESGAYGWSERVGNASDGASFTGSDCETRTGVFGPMGFSLYLAELTQEWWAWSYENGETSGSESWTGVGYSHDYVGENTLYLA